MDVEFQTVMEVKGDLMKVFLQDGNQMTLDLRKKILVLLKDRLFLEIGKAEIELFPENGDLMLCLMLSLMNK